MIRRLLMFVLVLGLAIPALASPLSHSASPAASTAATMHHHEHGQPLAPLTKHAGKHECIGCALADDAPAFVTIELSPHATPGWIRAVMPALFRAKPALPPPRA